MTGFFTELWAFFTAFADPYFAKTTVIEFFRGFWGYFKEFYLYVILGCLLGEALKFTSWTKLIYRFTVKYQRVAVLSATVLGILSPLCTYGTVPVLIALYGAGVPTAPLIAFLAASTMMNPQLFVMTWGGLGWEMAVARLLCVFVFSYLSGLLARFLPARFVIKNKLQGETALPDTPCCAPHEAGNAILNKKKPPFTWRAYGKAVVKNLLFVTKMMAIGIAIAAFVDLLPLSLLFGEADTTTVIGVLTAALAGIPIYACGGGTVPMVASLMAQGMSFGSALAFLTVGPATRVTALAAIAAVFKKRFLLVYVLLLLVFSVSTGMLITLF